MINTITKQYNLEGQFKSYLITYVNSNIQKSVPLVEDNTDYQAILTWIEDGGTVIDNSPE
tara:strand:+ start:1050 stop:1229 length:180 start_codon:yes stop_codon:yes gene_type:complete